MGRRAANRLSESAETSRKRIQACMKRWRAHNRFGQSLGRGLSEVELRGKVAFETGASRAQIRAALKRGD